RIALGVDGEQFVQVALRFGALSEGRREPAIPHAVDEGGRSLSAYRCRPVEPILAGEELRAGAAERKRLDSLRGSRGEAHPDHPAKREAAQREALALHEVEHRACDLLDGE